MNIIGDFLFVSYNFLIFSLSDQPDVVTSVRRYTDAPLPRSNSPPLEELAAMLKATSVE